MAPFKRALQTRYRPMTARIAPENRLTGFAGKGQYAPVCNAYELGKRGGSFSSHRVAQAITELPGEPEPALIRRTDPAPVYTGAEQLVAMRWGFERPGIGTINNSRADKLDGPLWGAPFRERRCLVPVAAYYEWSGPKGHKRTHRFTRANGRWLWVAGIWEESRDPGFCFSMITTEPNSLAAPIHDRMPAVLTDSELEPYLAGEIRNFRPPSEMLEVRDAPNPLVKRQPSRREEQTFLFPPDDASR